MGMPKKKARKLPKRGKKKPSRKRNVTVPIDGTLQSDFTAGQLTLIQLLHQTRQKMAAEGRL
jgi:hypothetical protein